MIETTKEVKLDLSLEALENEPKLEYIEDAANLIINPDLMILAVAMPRRKTKAGVDIGQEAYDQLLLKALDRPYPIINIGEKAKQLTGLNKGDKILLKNDFRAVCRIVVKNSLEEEVGMLIVSGYDFMIKVR